MCRGRPAMEEMSLTPVGTQPVVQWTEDGEARSARWRSESGAPPARRVVIADDRITADDAYGLACQGTGLLWRGDFQNARQLLVALANRADRQRKGPKRSAASSIPASPAEAFHLHRQARSQRARTLGTLLMPLDEDYGIPLRRAPDIRQACAEAYGPGEGPSVTSLRALLGVIGAHEWRIKGIEIAAIGGRIHPHYGVFAPIRSEYVDLVATAPCRISGLLPAWPSISAPGRACWRRARAARPQACGRHRPGSPRPGVRSRELERLGLAASGGRTGGSLSRRAGRARGMQSALGSRAPELSDRARDLRPRAACCAGSWARLPAHLEPGGEGWLILSDLAEHWACDASSELLAAFDAARVEGRGSKRCAAETLPGVRRNRPAPCGARSRGDIALAPRRALSRGSVILVSLSGAESIAAEQT